MEKTATAKVKVYTMNACPYCERAKQLLTQKGVPYQEIRVADDDDAAWDALYKKSGMRTMPQIFVTQEATQGTQDKLIGGYTELAALNSQKGLDSLK